MGVFSSNRETLQLNLETKLNNVGRVESFPTLSDKLTDNTFVGWEIEKMKINLIWLLYIKSARQHFYCQVFFYFNFSASLPQLKVSNSHLIQVLSSLPTSHSILMMIWLNSSPLKSTKWVSTTLQFPWSFVTAPLRPPGRVLKLLLYIFILKSGESIWIQFLHKIIYQTLRKVFSVLRIKFREIEYLIFKQWK